MLQILNISGTASHLPNQQPSRVPTLPLASITINKTSHVPSSDPSDHPSRSLSFSMGVHPSPLRIITPTTLPSDVQSDKPSDNPSIHSLQAPLFCQI